MATTELLSCIKSRKNLKHFSDLARIFGIARQSMQNYRRKITFFDDKRALIAAEILRIDAGAVLAAVRAERAECSEVKQAWLDLSICADGGKTLRIIETWREKDSVHRKPSAA